MHTMKIRPWQVRVRALSKGDIRNREEKEKKKRDTCLQQIFISPFNSQETRHWDSVMAWWLPVLPCYRRQSTETTLSALILVNSKSIWMLVSEFRNMPITTRELPVSAKVALQKAAIAMKVSILKVDSTHSHIYITMLLGSSFDNIN